MVGFCPRLDCPVTRGLVAAHRIAAGVVLCLASPVFAQWRGNESQRLPESVKTAREVPSRSTDTPMWENPRDFAPDVFVFARLRYGNDAIRLRGAGGSWTTDLPDADLNLSYRLQQMTAIKVDPYARILRANHPDLSRYPFLMASAAGAIDLEEDEVVGLRRYLLNGGFLLLTDFWGDYEWQHFAMLMKQVLPRHEFVEMPVDHPLYRCLFTINGQHQIPRIDVGVSHLRHGTPTWERGEDGRVVHHRAIFDDKGRLMVLALHNSDDSDGWEREGENVEYFHVFSEGKAYPLALNIIFYVMTH